MPDDSHALVVVAAGGLGTRVHGWARFIPKEFYPIGGRPGITRLLEEIEGVGPARVVIVYHPYYEQFAAWSRQVLSHHDHDRYANAAGTEVPAAIPESLTVSLIPQHGPYGDLTSVLNGADHLAGRNEFYVAFADNLYPGISALQLLRNACDGDVAVLASRYRPRLASSRGILITSPGANRELRHVKALVEKPDPAQARALEDKHGTGSLLMLEGRARLTSPFIQFARSRQHAAPGREPRLALAIDAYAREHPVVAILADGDVIDLGAAENIPSPREASWSATPCNSPVAAADTGIHSSW